MSSKQRDVKDEMEPPAAGADEAQASAWVERLRYIEPNEAEAKDAADNVR